MADDSTFVLSLRLETNEEQLAILNQRFRMEWHLYNRTVKEARKRLNKMYKDPEYKAIMNEYRKAKKQNPKASLSAEQKQKLKNLRKKYELGGPHCFEPFVKNGRFKFKKHIDSHSCQKLAKRVWNSVEKVLFSTGETVHYQKYMNFRAVEGKQNTTGIRYVNKKLVWFDLTIPVRIRKKDTYAKECLDSHSIKYCRIKRRWHKHQWRYYLELVLAGIPPMKSRTIGKGCVGIDIGPSTIAVVSQANVMLK